MSSRNVRVPWSLAMFAVLAGAALAVGAARACVVPTNLRGASHYESVKTADAVVLARATAPVPDGTEPRRGIDFQVTAVLAGSPPAQLRLPGRYVDREQAPTSARDEVDFSEPRGIRDLCGPGGAYVAGQQYLLLLVRAGSGWTLQRGMRTSEPVDDDSSIWYRAVSQYVRIAHLHDYETEKRALRELQAREQVRDGKPTALADDIERHFRQPSPLMSYRDLRALYDAADDDDARESVLWAWMRNVDPEAQPLFAGLFERGRADGLVAAYFEALRDRRMLEPFAAAFLAGPGEGKSWQEPSPIAVVLAVARDEDIELVLRAYDAARSDFDTDRIEEWLALYPSTAARGALRSHIHDRGSDFRAVYALAATGDAKIARWAIEVARRGAAGDDGVALGALAHSPLPEADAAVAALISANDARLGHLLYGYEGSVNPNAGKRLAQMVDMKKRSLGLTWQLIATIEKLQRDGRMPEAGKLLERLRDADGNPLATEPDKGA